MKDGLCNFPGDLESCKDDRHQKRRQGKNEFFFAHKYRSPFLQGRSPGWARKENLPFPEGPRGCLAGHIGKGA